MPQFKVTPSLGGYLAMAEADARKYWDKAGDLHA